MIQLTGPATLLVEQVVGAVNDACLSLFSAQVVQTSYCLACGMDSQAALIFLASPPGKPSKPPSWMLKGSVSTFCQLEPCQLAVTDNNQPTKDAQYTAHLVVTVQRLCKVQV
jgi:hypothetical protein